MYIGLASPAAGHLGWGTVDTLLASVEPQRSRGFFELNYCSKQLLSSTADCAALLSALAEAGSGGGLGACAENKGRVWRLFPMTWRLAGRAGGRKGRSLWEAAFDIACARAVGRRRAS